MQKLERNCPDCGCLITYKSLNGFYVQRRKNGLCRKCCIKGERNGFHGKKHTKEFIEKAKLRTNDYNKTPEFAEKMRQVVLSNPDRNRKPVYECWLEKYGKEEADRRDIIRKEKWSQYKGPLSSSYGKPAPQGSGNGWKGWYKGHFFRSLRELSFIIKVIERFNFKWESAEKYREEYIDYLDNKRTYCADFLLNDKYLIEIKPKNLHNTPLVSLKKEAGIRLANKKGWKYKIVDCKIISLEQIKKLYDDKIIIFQDKYNKKFEEYYAKNHTV